MGRDERKRELIVWEQQVREGGIGVMTDHALLLEDPPGGWMQARLDDICRRVQDAASPSANGQRLYLGLEHLASGLPTLVGRGKESDVRSGKTTFCKDDILFGKLRPYLRKSVLVSEDGICSTDILVFRATEKCIPEFLCLLTHTDEFVGHAKKTTSGVQHPRTSWAALREFKLYVPPLPEQRKIAAVLGLVQQAIEQQERLITLIAELKKTLLHQLFTQGLRGEPQKQTEIGPVPESWGVVRLGNWSHLITKGSSPNWQGFNYQGSGILFIRSQNVGWGIINNGFEYLPDDFNKVQARSILKQSDILINLVGASIGRVAIAPKQFEGANTNQAVGLIRINTDGFKPEYIMYFLLTIMGQKIIKGNVKEIARANISLSDINNFLVPKADIDEQEEIVKYLEIIDQRISFHTHKKQKFEELFRTLLHQLMTAQIRVHDLDMQELRFS